MKNWLRLKEKTIIVSAFIIPIIIVAVVSISHVTQWYGISNPLTWAVYLSVGIEIAALSSLAAITARLGKNVYFPFIIVTLIQFIGNVFFSYSYINIQSIEFKNWVELVTPIVNLIGVEPTDLIGHKRFLSFFAGGLLPVISLSFLHMLVKFTEEDNLKEPKEEKLEKETPKDINEEDIRVKLTDDDLSKLENILLKPHDELKKSWNEFLEKNNINNESKVDATLFESNQSQVIEEEQTGIDDNTISEKSRRLEIIDEENVKEEKLDEDVPEKIGEDDIMAKLTDDDLSKLENILLKPHEDLSSDNMLDDEDFYSENDENIKEEIINSIIDPTPTPTIIKSVDIPITESSNQIAQMLDLENLRKSIINEIKTTTQVVSPTPTPNEKIDNDPIAMNDTEIPEELELPEDIEDIDKKKT